MSATTTGVDQSLLEMIAADEQTLLRTGQAARELLARHADLPLKGARLRFDSEIRLNPHTADGVRAWAERLGAETTTNTSDPGYGPVFRHTAAEVTIDGTLVRVWHCHILDDAETAAWRENRGRS
ncbi:hypothetical protein [Streptomyces yatensis]|uniref:hypothetical protein n=1 Tax=Streptomyces yatensis TaxID=155177 RepID=UPI001B3C65E6|nr:hypothetical protein [Streptomyces yatensis]